MLVLLYITYNCNSYSLNIYVNWKRFVKFIKYESLSYNCNNMSEYHSNLISAYLLNDTRQKIIHMNVGTKK